MSDISKVSLASLTPPSPEVEETQEKGHAPSPIAIEQVPSSREESPQGSPKSSSGPSFTYWDTKKEDPLETYKKLSPDNQELISRRGSHPSDPGVFRRKRSNTINDPSLAHKEYEFEA